MRISLRYFEGCPHWEKALDRIGEALGSTGLRAEVILEEVTAERAEGLGFAGSPTILIDGLDPFPLEDRRAGISCRVYQTEWGAEGSPSVAQLATALSPGSVTPWPDGRWEQARE